MNDIRLGVFICDCGDRIGSILDMDLVERRARELPGAVAVNRLRYSCSPVGLAAIRSSIAEARLNRVLVAGCTPRTLLPRFRSAGQEVGLHGSFVELVDIRESCAWAHRDEPAMASIKAVDLIRMGAARLIPREAPAPVNAVITPAALVIGGGVAGMTAALTLARAGQRVTLVEREVELGGMLRDTLDVGPHRHRATPPIAETVQAVISHPSIEVLTHTVVTGLSGTPGQYLVDVNGTGQQREVGAIIVATGAQSWQPWGQFRYDGRRVVTQVEFERELRNNLTASRVIMILCAGQRDEEVSYCSGVCCLGALKQAIEVKTVSPGTSVTIVFRDFYLHGEDAHERQLVAARQAGVEFVHHAPSSPSEVTGEEVIIRDEADGTERRLPCDRVVLATPLVPQPDASVLAHTLGITQDRHGFFPEVRYRLRPQNYAERGIYVCGAAHHPADWTEAEFQATSTALRAALHLRTGSVCNQAPVAVVDDRLCTGCGSCVTACGFGAIAMHKQNGLLDLARIEPLRCAGCGNCVVTCPVKAISQPIDDDTQVLAQIEAALATAPPNGGGRILVFGCEWSGHAAAELAGARGLQYPAEIRLIRTACAARFDPLHILWGLLNGAEGVFLGACPPGKCHFRGGNEQAQKRFDTLRSLLVERGFDSRRLRWEWIIPDNPREFVEKITRFAELVRVLGPSSVFDE